MADIILEKDKFPESIGGGLKGDVTWHDPIYGIKGRWSIAFANNSRLTRDESEDFRRELICITGRNWQVDKASKFIFHCYEEDQGEFKMAKRKSDKPLIHTSQEPHRVKFTLTNDEKAEAANELASSYMQLESLAIEKKTAMSEFKNRRERIEERIHTLSLKVKEGVEMRSVLCELRLDYSSLRATVIRLDTEEIVEEREMTEDEKQMKFEFEKKEKVDKKKHSA